MEITSDLKARELQGDDSMLCVLDISYPLRPGDNATFAIGNAFSGATIWAFRARGLRFNEQMPSQLFRLISIVDELDLSGLQVSHLPRQAFSGLTTRTLNLTGMEVVSKMAEKAFEKLVVSRALLIPNMRIPDGALVGRAFAGLTLNGQNGRIDLTRSELRSLGEGEVGPFDGLITVTGVFNNTSIDLSNNLLSTIHKRSLSGASVAYINISANNISRLAPGWSNSIVKANGVVIMKPGNPSVCRTIQRDTRSIHRNTEFESALSGQIPPDIEVVCSCTPNYNIAGSSYCWNASCSATDVARINKQYSHGRYSSHGPGGNTTSTHSISFDCDSGFELQSEDPRRKDFAIQCVGSFFNTMALPEYPVCVRKQDGDALLAWMLALAFISLLINGWLQKDVNLRLHHKHKSHTDEWECKKDEGGCGKRFATKAMLLSHQSEDGSFTREALRKCTKKLVSRQKPGYQECPFCPIQIAHTGDCEANFGHLTNTQRNSAYSTPDTPDICKCVKAHIDHERHTWRFIPRDSETGAKLWKLFFIELGYAIATIVPGLAIQLTKTARNDLKAYREDEMNTANARLLEDKLSRLAALREWEIPMSRLSPRESWKELGRGAFGMVWKAEYEYAPAALKEMTILQTDAANEDHDAFDPDSVRMVKDGFDHELKTMKGLRHPNLVSFFGVVEGRYLLIEYLEYGTLRDLLKGGVSSQKWNIIAQAAARSGSMSGRGAQAEAQERQELPGGWIQRFEFCRCIVAGMRYLHAATPPLIHRDLKGENCLIGKGGTLKIADFGTAKLGESATASHRCGITGVKGASLTRSVMMQTGGVGTPAFMAPELWIGMKYRRIETLPDETALDIFSFSMVLHEIASDPYISPHGDLEEDLLDRGIVIPADDRDSYVLSREVYGESLMAFQHAIENKNARPRLTKACRKHVPDGYQQLMEECWSKDPKRRPDFEDIYARIRDIKSAAIAKAFPSGMVRAQVAARNRASIAQSEQGGLSTREAVNSARARAKPHAAILHRIGEHAAVAELEVAEPPGQTAIGVDAAVPVPQRRAAPPAEPHRCPSCNAKVSFCMCGVHRNRKQRPKTAMDGSIQQTSV